MSDDIYQAPHAARGRFFNPWGARVLPGARDLLRWQLSRNPNRKRKRRRVRLPVVPDPLARFEAAGPHTRVLWLGHASFLVETAGVRLLIDPVFGRAGGVLRRVTPDVLTVSQLPHIDAVLLTHGHHDHLDAGSARALGRRFGDALTFFVPLGLSRMLPRACRRVRELDWWQSVRLGDVELVFVPAQHWHRRGLADTNRALWGGWVVRGEKTVYHSGDSGFFGGFAAIGRAAEIDLALLPAGGWEPEWFMHSQHMSPTDAIRAFEALGATHCVAMHWGTFDLSDEPVDAGPDVLLAAAYERDLADRVHVLQHGETFAVANGSPTMRVGG